MVSDIHLIRLLLRAVAREELPGRVVIDLALHHLLELCPHCRGEVTAWECEQRAASRREPAAPPSPSADAEKRAKSRERAAAQHRATRDFRRLLGIPGAQRLQQVRRARRRFRGAELITLLLEESARRRAHDVEEAYGLAELARAVAEQSPECPARFEAVALATAHMANARRVAGNLRDADELFAFVRDLARRQGVVDPRVLAQLDHLEASLRTDQRLFDVAEVLLRRAAMLYRLSGDRAGVGRVFLKLGGAYYQAGRLDQALDATRSALRRLRRDRDPWLYHCGRYNLALYLTEMGQCDEAAAILAADESLHRKFRDPWSQLRLTWLRGKIAAGTGNYSVAEEALLAARDGFARHGAGLDAAAVSLDLALLYLHHGRSAELLRLAEEVASVFAAQDVHREAAAALVLFQKAVRQQALTAEMVRELTAYLRAARVDPELRFREPA